MRVLLALITLSVLASCSTHSNHEEALQATNPREYQVGAYLWQQTSGEYRALTYQAYNIAKEKVARDLEDKHNKKRAVIFDIDETILDNSVGGAREIKSGYSWQENHFADWVKLKQAVAIPGALDFIKFLQERQVEIFYITNRAPEMFNDTYDNLVAQGFPIKKTNLMMLTPDHSKEGRRLEVQKKYEVVLLVGDNLSDFNKEFDKKMVKERNASTDKMRDLFGQKYIILPNPLYGDWERALPQVDSRVELLNLGQ
jgi:5'-nucleotidase (lipoprotein e(P4) family)